jgi:hypothetical protein
VAGNEWDVLRQGVLDEKFDARIALECFLLVKLGLRRVAIVSIPAELPDGEVLGAEVDFEFRTRLSGAARDLRTRFNDTVERKRLNPVAFKVHLMRSSFANNVLVSESYLAHRDLARSLGLQVIESEVRPTIHEWYVCRPEDAPTVTALLKRRHAIQKEMRGKYKPEDPVSYYIYPEERDEAHVRALGELLGYPRCCVEEYLKGRLVGEGRTPDIPEDRASRQLREVPGDGAGSAAATAFWLKDFFPCHPGCEAAVEKGRVARAALASVDPKLAEVYDELCRKNLERVERGLRDIEEHQKWLSRRADDPGSRR